MSSSKNLPLEPRPFQREAWRPGLSLVTQTNVQGFSLHLVESPVPAGDVRPVFPIA